MMHYTNELTEEERKLIKDCEIAAAVRGVTFGMIGWFGLRIPMLRRNTYPDPPLRTLRWLFPLCSGAMGLLIGYFSYQGERFRKLMALENSPLKEKLIEEMKKAGIGFDENGKMYALLQEQNTEHRPRLRNHHNHIWNKGGGGDVNLHSSEASEGKWKTWADVRKEYDPRGNEEMWESNSPDHVPPVVVASQDETKTDLKMKINQYGDEIR